MSRCDVQHVAPDRFRILPRGFCTTVTVRIAEAISDLERNIGKSVCYRHLGRLVDYCITDRLAVARTSLSALYEGARRRLTKLPSRTKAGGLSLNGPWRPEAVCRHQK
jgi:hypothetical protein